MSLRDKILAVTDIQLIGLAVPEWKETVYLREITAAEWQKMKKLTDANDDDADMAFLISSVCDQDGKPIFNAEDIPALKQKSAVVLNRILNAAMKHNGIGEVKN